MEPEKRRDEIKNIAERIIAAPPKPPVLPRKSGIQAKTDSNDEASIQPIIERILIACRKAHNASSISDVHIVEGEVPWARVDGELEELSDLDPIDADEIRGFYEKHIVSNNTLLESLSKKGHFSTSIQSETYGDVRVHVLRKTEGTDMVIRLLHAEVPDIKNLNLPSKISEFADTQNGLYLFTGATGSGKSTALAALINLINKKYPKNIITIEDPIEYRHKPIKSLIRQQTIGTNYPSYAEAIRSALRSDPDVILIGEMRDTETIRAALQAAETGHLVFSTLHDNGATQTVQRIIGSFSGDEQAQIQMSFSTVLRGIVSLRLIKQASGEGRLPAAEILIANDAIRSQIREAKYQQIATSLAQGTDQGMQILEDQLNIMVTRGDITYASAQAAANNPELINKPAN